MLSFSQAAGLLQRFMSHHNAAEWLENDRRHNPLIPYIQAGETVVYPEDEVVRFAKRLSPQATFRSHDNRRDQDERRLVERERRQFSDRRHKRKIASINNLDRRFAVRQDRRSDLDRRIRGWVDRRCVDDRRE